MLITTINIVNSILAGYLVCCIKIYYFYAVLCAVSSISTFLGLKPIPLSLPQPPNKYILLLDRRRVNNILPSIDEKSE